MLFRCFLVFRACSMRCSPSLIAAVVASAWSRCRLRVFSLASNCRNCACCALYTSCARSARDCLSHSATRPCVFSCSTEMSRSAWRTESTLHSPCSSRCSTSPYARRSIIASSATLLSMLSLESISVCSTAWLRRCWSGSTESSMRWKSESTASRFLSKVSSPRCCAFLRIGHESLCIFQKMRSRQSSGSTLPCMRLGSGALKMFEERLGSCMMWHQPLSMTCCGGQKLCSSSYQSFGLSRLGCSAIGLPRWSNVPAIDTLMPGSSSDGTA